MQGDGNPVHELPGLTPRSPVTTAPAPALVTAEFPSTAKLCADPSDGAVATASAAPVGATTSSAATPTLATSLQYLPVMLNLAFPSQGRSARRFYPFSRRGPIPRGYGPGAV